MLIDEYNLTIVGKYEFGLSISLELCEIPLKQDLYKDEFLL